MAQLMKCLTLDFRSDQDLRVVGLSPALLHAGQGLLGMLSNPCPTPVLRASLNNNNKRKIEKGGQFVGPQYVDQPINIFKVVFNAIENNLRFSFR